MDALSFVYHQVIARIGTERLHRRKAEEILELADKVADRYVGTKQDPSLDGSLRDALRELDGMLPVVRLYVCKKWGLGHGGTIKIIEALRITLPDTLRPIYWEETGQAFIKEYACVNELFEEEMQHTLEQYEARRVVREQRRKEKSRANPSE